MCGCAPGRVELWRQGRHCGGRIPTDGASRVLVNFTNRPEGSVPGAFPRLRGSSSPKIRRDCAANLAGQLVLLGWGALGTARRAGHSAGARRGRPGSRCRSHRDDPRGTLGAASPATGMVFLLTWMLLFLGSQMMMRSDLVAGDPRWTGV